MEPALKLLREVLFRLHWLPGIVAGLVLAFMGVTGSMLSFEEEIVHAFGGGIVHVEPRAETALEPPALLAQAREAKPGRAVQSVAVFSEPGASARVVYAPETGSRKGEPRHLDPYTGALLPPSGAESLMETVEDLHRRLAWGDNGRAITGACALAFIAMLLTGGYLRWPRNRAWHWRTWLTFNPRLSGRPYLRGLHATVASWMFLPLLVTALTGPFFAYDWYKAGVYAIAGVPKPPARKPPGPVEKKEEPTPVAAPDVAVAWTAFKAAMPAYQSVTLRVPDKPGGAAQFTVLPVDAPHPRATDRIEIDLATGETRKHERHVEKSAGGKLIAGMYPLHTGSYFGLPGRIAMFVSALALPLFAITGWMMYLRRRRAGSAPSRAVSDDAPRSLPATSSPPR